MEWREKIPSLHSFSDSAHGADGGEEESNPDLRNAGIFLRLSAKQLLLVVGPEDVPTETLLIRDSHLSP